MNIVLLSLVAVLLTVSPFAVRGQSPSTYTCIPGQGFSFSPHYCSSSYPCTALLSTYALTGTTILSEAQSPPSHCRGLNGGKFYNDGTVKSINVAPSAGTEAAVRYYCSYSPPAASATAKVPLLIFTHGSGGSAKNSYGNTPYRVLAENASRPFVFVSPHAMNRHWPASGAIGTGEDGTKWDFFYRNISDNADVHFIDAIIDHYVNVEQTVDPSRIYIAGHSNGGYFAAFYARARAGTTNAGSLGTIRATTPGGYRIAAAAPFSSADPYVRPFATPDCTVSDIGTIAVPILVAVRQCDLVVCSSVNDFTAKLRTHGSAQSQTLALGVGDEVFPDPANCTEPSWCNYGTKLTGHSDFPQGHVMQVMLDFLWRFTSSSSTGVSSTTLAPAPTGSIPVVATLPATNTPPVLTLNPSALSTTTQPRGPPPQSGDEVNNRRNITFEIRLSGTRWADVLNNQTRTSTLRQALRADIAARLSTTIERILILFLRVGSLEVGFQAVDTNHTEASAESSFTTGSSADSTLPQTATTYAEVSSELVAVSSASVTSTTPFTTTLGPTVVSTTTPTPFSDTSSSCTSGCVILIIIAVIVIIGVVVAVGVVLGVVCIGKQNTTTDDEQQKHGGAGGEVSHHSAGQEEVSSAV